MAQWPTTAILMLAGVGVIGAQVGVTALASMTYPVTMRATGFGWALGVGRVGSIVGPTIGGFVLATAADPRSVYLGCIVPVLIGMAAVALLKRQRRAGAAAGHRKLTATEHARCARISASNASPPKRRSRRRTSFAPTASCSRARARTTSASTA